MFNRELNFSDIIFLAILCGVISIIFGCSSAPKTVAPNVYYCPNKHKIPMEKINKDIRAINTCTVCGAKFPYMVRVREADSSSGGQRQNYGPRIYGPSSTYQSDINYQRFDAGGYSFKKNFYGFSEMSWRFHDSRVKSRRVIPYWRTTSYHYP